MFNEATKYYLNNDFAIIIFYQSKHFKIVLVNHINKYSMQPASQFTPTSRNNFSNYVPPFKSDHNGPTTFHNHAIGVGSPKTNY